MGIRAAAYTDIGVKKSVNQDSYCIKIADTGSGLSALVAVCDGMGGLEQGEVASGNVIRAFSDWFLAELPLISASGRTYDFDQAVNQWDRILSEQNQILVEQGNREGIMIGTTATVVLLMEGAGYAAAHIGDSRLYKVGQDLDLLTQDHTLVALELARGAISPAEAMTDPRRNVLLQCIGVNDELEPDYFEDISIPSGQYLLCTDGFRHLVSAEELYASVTNVIGADERTMQECLRYLTELNIARGETDNITAILVEVD